MTMTMDDQTSFDDLILVGSDASIQARFVEFHEAHPQVYVRLRDLAFEWLHAGHPSCGIGMLWEVLRWRTGLGAEEGEDTYRLNNNYRSRYARMLAACEPELASFFETRELRA